uniref:Uncharacterized protein n=1 Tax=Setaria italica TaxID=4555 RepID=K4ANB9_SETIT
MHSFSSFREWLGAGAGVLGSDWQTARAASSSSLTVQAKDGLQWSRARLMSHDEPR